MPPKRFRYFSKTKNLSQKSEEVDAAKGCKQITISKFFSSSTTKRKTSDNDDNEDVTIIVEENDEENENVKERKISSPQRKKAKVDQKSTNDSLQASTSDQQNTHQENHKVTVPKSISDLLSRTKDKLQSFVSESEDDSAKKLSVKSFDFNCLKREKANILTDDAENKSEETTTQISYADDVNAEVTDHSDMTQSKYHSGKLSKFVSLKSKGKATKSQSGARTSKTEVGIKYTQLEQQFMEIKEKNPDTVLFVECGYKYRFFGKDAEIAAEVLKIYCHLDHNFMTASIPVHRLFVHVRRLVSAGYKVGVVKQMETAALKAAGSNKSAPFSRQLTDLYTKATLIGEESGSSEGMEGSHSVGGVTNYLMCVCDYTTDTTTNKNNKKHTIGIMAVQPSTGDIVYDSFQDCDQRVELETRLSHLHPVEVLLSQHASAPTERLVIGLQTISPTQDDRMRIERLDRSVFEYNTAFALVSDFYKESIDNGTVKLQEIVNLPNAVICCLAGLITYLRDFKLDSIFLEIGNFSQFSTNSKFMQLNSCTLKNLEIFHNSTNGSERGSLFWALNQTVSKVGAQMLKSWLSKPLLEYSEIIKRQEAVTSIMSGEFPDWQKIRGLLAGLPDLQRALSAVYYKKCSPLDFYNMCRAFKRVYDEFLIQKEALSGHVTSSLLRCIVKEIPELLVDIDVFQNALVEKAAKENDKTKLFSKESRYPAIVECKADIETITQEIHAHRREVRLALRLPALEYTTVSGTEFLIEVKNKDLSLVPKSWSKISSTKTVSRFHSPFIVEKYKLLQQGREKLVLVCQEAWLEFLDEYLCCYQLLRKVVQLLATLDCLFSMATVAGNHGYCRPQIVEDEVCIGIDGGRHPVIEELLGESQQYVPNDTKMSEKGEHAVIITGPNMGGKSSYIKQVAIIAIMAQMGSYVPAQSATLGILDAVFTRMGAMDEIFSRRSTFMVELQEAADIMAKVTSRSLVILDELGRGTSTHDGTAIAHATLKYFIMEPRCLTLFVTHYPLLAEFEDVYPGAVANFHMSFMVHDDQDSDFDKVTFLYQLVRGVANRSFGLNVASLADVPESVIKKATQKSLELEQTVMNKRNQTICLQKVFSEDVGSLKDFINSILIQESSAQHY